jgi:hypothetical protein
MVVCLDLECEVLGGERKQSARDFRVGQEAGWKVEVGSGCAEVRQSGVTK